VTDWAPLDRFRDTGGLTSRLTRAGLSPSAAAAKTQLADQCVRALVRAGAAAQTGAIGFAVPGRIEVLGKHTDYAGGRSLLAATERGFCILACPREDNLVRITAAAGGVILPGEPADRPDETVEFPIDPSLEVQVGSWPNYAMTVARRLALKFGGERPLRGATVAFASDLPPAAGMSSSSALLVACYLVLAEINDLPSRAVHRRNIPDLESLAGYLGTVENGQSFGELTGDKGVGTFGGSEDHTAILCSRPGRLSQYSYCPVRPERQIPFPDGYALTVGCSGVVAEKTGAAREKFNRASGLARAAVETWNRATGRNDPHLAAAVQSSPEAASGIRVVLRNARSDYASSDELLNRFEQFYAENERVLPLAGKALAEGNLDLFGRCVDESQDLAERLLGNQVPETIWLARSARQIGAAAASGFGAGFGGSVWALVRTADAPAMLAEWSARYAKEFPAAARGATFFITGAGPAAFGLLTSQAAEEPRQ